MMLQLNPYIAVYARKHGYGDAICIVDYGHMVNSMWIVRFEGGIIKHFYSDNILVVGNPADGQGWDIKIPKSWK